MTNKKRLLRTALCVYLVSYIGACAIKTPPSAKEVLVDTLPDSSHTLNNWSSTFNNGKVIDGWMSSFEDPALNALVAEILANNQNLQAAAAKVDAASALAIQAGATLKPTIGLSGSGSTTGAKGLSSNLNSGNVFLSVSWELDIWGRIRSGVAAAEALNRSVQSDFEYARQSLAALTAKTWFLATQVRMQQKLAQEAVDIFSELVSLVEKRQHVGRANPQDLSQAKARLANAEANLRLVKSSFLNIVRSMEVLLGRYPSAELNVNADYLAQLPTVPAGIPAEILERRPDLVAAESRVVAAFNLTQQSRAARLPRIKLTASAGAADNGLTDILNTSNPIASLGANLFAPLYTGGALKAAVEEADAKQRAAMFDYAQSVLSAFQEIETALFNEQLYLERENYLREEVNHNQEAYRITEAQYKVGRVDLLSLLQNQASLLSARSSLIAVKNERLSQRVNLHLALGGSFEAKETDTE